MDLVRTNESIIWLAFLLKILPSAAETSEKQRRSDMSDTKRYPTRMHEVLGVEPDKEYTFKNKVTQFNFYIDTKGHAFIADKSEGDYLCAYYLTQLINHPERIIRKPRLSEEQVRQLQALVTLGYRWLIKDSTDAVFAYAKMPAKQSEWWNCGGANVRIFIDLPPGILTSLVSWSDPAPLDIVQVLRENGVEVE